ncbi:ParA family protein, partial [Vibrio parahaemolyticus]
MKLISVFNNKGGVGKSTLTYHLGAALAEKGV